jgi:hypothetical protein
VPKNKTGIRITLSRYITIQDIDNLLEMVNNIFFQLETAGKLDREVVKKRFLEKNTTDLVII